MKNVAGLLFVAGIMSLCAMENNQNNVKDDLVKQLKRKQEELLFGGPHKKYKSDNRRAREVFRYPAGTVVNLDPEWMKDNDVFVHGVYCVVPQGFDTRLIHPTIVPQSLKEFMPK